MRALKLDARHGVDKALAVILECRAGRPVLVAAGLSGRLEQLVGDLAAGTVIPGRAHLVPR